MRTLPWRAGLETSQSITVLSVFDFGHMYSLCIAILGIRSNVNVKNQTFVYLMLSVLGLMLGLRVGTDAHQVSMLHSCFILVT